MNAVSLFEKAKDKNDTDSFKNPDVKSSFRKHSDGEVIKYFNDNDTNYTTNRLEDTINESIYHLKIKIFGADRLGLSSYIQSRLSIRGEIVKSFSVDNELCHKRRRRMQFHVGSILHS
jgi:hypothetical protein